MANAAPSTANMDLAGSRLLLVTPHPDDESLALGGLIQLAVRQGAEVTLLQVTDGDNNPWPQRWLERRWRIGPADRQRWGRRRVGEVRQAIDHLGLPPTSLQRLGWPDMGVGKRLCDGRGEAIDRFARILRDTMPDIVVLPALNDRHPDHGASHVLTRLALARLAQRPGCLTYLVHGKDAPLGEPYPLALDAVMREAKRRAVLAHGSQVALARRRLLAMVGPTERLHRWQPPEYARPEAAPPATVPLPWRPPRFLRPWLQLTVAHPDGIHVWPWHEAPLQGTSDAWRLTLPAGIRRPPVFARLETRHKSPWIFDHWGWCDLGAIVMQDRADADQ